MKSIVAALALAAFAWPGYAQETIIEVPQGSGVLPTIGQVNCLEELGSGRYCAATYECSGGVSGELWGDLANHDGRRAIDAASPVANGRDCVVTVDGKAAVRWLTGYRPAGRTGELVGLTTSAAALRPVQRIVRPAGESHSVLEYLLELYPNDTLRETIEAVCEEGYPHCIDHNLVAALTLHSYRLGPATKCVADRTSARGWSLADQLVSASSPRRWSIDGIILNLNGPDWLVDCQEIAADYAAGMGIVKGDDGLYRIRE